jgi:hypothetical protein
MTPKFADQHGFSERGYYPEIRSDDDMYYIRIADFTRFDPAERASES